MPTLFLAVLDTVNVGIVLVINLSVIYLQVPEGSRITMDWLNASARLMIVSDLDHTMVGCVIGCFSMV